MQNEKIMNQQMDDFNPAEDRSFFIYDDISAKSIKDIIECLIKIDEHDIEHLELEIEQNEVKLFEPAPIHLHITTYGGVVYDMFALIGRLLAMKAPVYTYANGYVMSAGVPIFLCGQKRFISEYCTLMLHNSCGGAIGSPSQLQNELEQINVMDKMYNEIIYDVVKDLDVDIYEKKLEQNKDWYLNTYEALRQGFATHLLSGETFEELIAELDTVLEEDISLDK